MHELTKSLDKVKQPETSGWSPEAVPLAVASPNHTRLPTNNQSMQRELQSGAGLVAWNDFMREKGRQLRVPGKWPPTQLRVEETTLRRMQELLSRNPGIATREMPAIAYARIRLQVMAEMGK